MNTKTKIAILLFMIVQFLVTGACCKLSAEKYFFRDTDCKLRTINVCYGKLLDSQKTDMTLGKDPSEEEVIELFQNQKNRYSNGSRVVPEKDTVYFYDYDRKTGVLTTYVKVCKPEPYEYKYFGDIAKKLSEMEITEETAKKEVLGRLKKESK